MRFGSRFWMLVPRYYTYLLILWYVYLSPSTLCSSQTIVCAIMCPRFTSPSSRLSNKQREYEDTYTKHIKPQRPQTIECAIIRPRFISPSQASYQTSKIWSTRTLEQNILNQRRWQEHEQRNKKCCILNEEVNWAKNTLYILYILLYQYQYNMIRMFVRTFKNIPRILPS